MMTNKYYTPELEEFHHGFEYDKYDTLDGKSGDPQWLRLFVDKPFGSEDDRYMMSESLIRIKYLDKQDIEDCGFEHIADRNFDDYYKHLKTGIGLFAPKSASTFINIVIAEDFLIKHIDIKNINEFRKLLKQLGI